MLKTLLFSFKKSKLLYRIASESSQKIGSKDMADQILNNLAQEKQPTKRDVYVEELFALLRKDKPTLALLSKYGRTFDDLREIIRVLELSGAGQIVKGHYVAISSIAFLGQLSVILEYWDGEHFTIENQDHRNSSLTMCNYLLNSFE